LQGVSAVKAFYELLSQSSISVLHPDKNKPVAPVELCPILKMLYRILITRYVRLCSIISTQFVFTLALGIAVL
jgi:glycerol-3-phosphate dehydrogenase (NAD+)